ncbi:MAG: family transposase [Hyphomicrobiales bacterium]|nr:family transposase [Hyphomicrobiales bacterium]
MWTNDNRAKYDRDRLRYPSDLTDTEWAHIAPLIPPDKRGGRKRFVDLREVVNGIMYVLSTGCHWRYVPKDLPPRSTLFDYFDLWDMGPHARAHPPRPLCPMPRGHGTRTQSNRVHYR